MKKILVFAISMFLLSALVLAQGGQNPEAGDGSPEPMLLGANDGTGAGTQDGAGEGAGAQEDMGQGENPGTGQGDMILEQTQVKLQDGSGDGSQTKAMNQQKLQTGLENALENVKNENAKQQLQQNIEKFQQKYEVKLQKMEGLEITEVNEETGAVKLKAKEEVKFLGFIKGKASKTYNMDAEGNIKEKKSWYRFLYKEISE